MGYLMIGVSITNMEVINCVMFWGIWRYCSLLITSIALQPILLQLKMSGYNKIVTISKWLENVKDMDSQTLNIVSDFDCFQ